jgi:hypothetical protein
MAAEQHQGLAVDARADQYAFCVALWEALYGELPFAGTDPISYGRAVVEGAVRMPADQRDTPPWVRRVIERGLAPSPAARYASMDELLAELSYDDPPALRETRAAAIVVLGGLFSLLGFYPAVAHVHYGPGGIAVSSSIALAALLITTVVARNGELTPVNARLVRLLATPIAMTLMATGAAALLHLDGYRTRMMLLLIWSAMSAMAAAALGVWLWLAASAYAGGFLIAAALPEAIHLAVGTGHLLLMVNAVAIWGRPGSRRSAPA